jgi:hypothetical protein
MSDEELDKLWNEFYYAYVEEVHTYRLDFETKEELREFIEGNVPWHEIGPAIDTHVQSLSVINRDHEELWEDH